MCGAIATQAGVALKTVYLASPPTIQGGFAAGRPLANPNACAVDEDPFPRGQEAAPGTGRCSTEAGTPLQASSTQPHARNGRRAKSRLGCADLVIRGRRGSVDPDSASSEHIHPCDHSSTTSAPIVPEPAHGKKGARPAAPLSVGPAPADTKSSGALN